MKVWHLPIKLYCEDDIALYNCNVFIKRHPLSLYTFYYYHYSEYTDVIFPSH